MHEMLNRLPQLWIQRPAGSALPADSLDLHNQCQQKCGTVRQGNGFAARPSSSCLDPSLVVAARSSTRTARSLILNARCRSEAPIASPGRQAKSAPHDLLRRSLYTERAKRRRRADLTAKDSKWTRAQQANEAACDEHSSPISQLLTRHAGA